MARLLAVCTCVQYVHTVQSHKESAPPICQCWSWAPPACPVRSRRQGTQQQCGLPEREQRERERAQPLRRAGAGMSRQVASLPKTDLARLMKPRYRGGQWQKPRISARNVARSGAFSPTVRATCSLPEPAPTHPRQHSRSCSSSSSQRQQQGCSKKAHGPGRGRPTRGEHAKSRRPDRGCAAVCVHTVAQRIFIPPPPPPPPCRLRKETLAKGEPWDHDTPRRPLAINPLTTHKRILNRAAR